MKTLTEYIADARAQKIAVGHFNVSNLEGLWAIYRAARACDLPVIVGASEGERDFVGVKQIVALVRSLREGEGYPIFLNADHTYSVERVKEAIDAGFDAVIFDGAKMTFAENVSKTQECVSYARTQHAKVLVEAELGYIGQSSKILDKIPEGAAVDASQHTSVEDAVNFVKETGVDLFSPAIGSIHGMLRATNDPDLNIVRIKEIAAAVEAPLVLHGASGLREKNIREAIEGGISVVHINTELRVRFVEALKKSLAEHPDEIAPYRVMKPAVDEMQAEVESKLRLFSGK